jgi:salicylate hydroxylase
LGLHRSGFDVHVYEQANVLREVGAGVAISPNAVKVLNWLSVSDTARTFGVTSLSMDYRDFQSGALLGRVPLGDDAVARWGAPFYHFHRADLHNALRSGLGDDHITLGSRCVALEEDGSGVTIRLANGRTASGDLVIGADGIHSVVRDYVAGPDRPIWSHQISWRGLAPASIAQAVGLEVRHHSFWGPHKQFVAFYVSHGDLVNWVGNTESIDDWREESWSAKGDRDEVLELFSDWHPQVRALISGTDQVFKWALFDRPALNIWNRGRVTLLGDAAHPMLPFQAQGASQSLEDAYVLVHCLKKARLDVLSAITDYVQRRCDRTAAVQASARDAGRMVQLTDAGQVATRNARLARDPEAPIDRFDWIWSYDPESEFSKD